MHGLGQTPQAKGGGKDAPATRPPQFPPSFAIVDTAGQHDNKRAREVCATIQADEIVVFGKAYVDFDHLTDLDERGV